ncbi:MAG: DUF21 domain-containing protein [Clostridia bacterium]|nr:DUF21 domain-containing protein [Clostridia bacterium]
MTNDIDSSNIDVHLPEKDGDNFDAESKVNPQNPLKNSENSEDLSETAQTFGVEKAAVVDSSQKQKDKHQNDDKKKKPVKKKYNLWWLKVTIISFFLAGFFSFLSELTATSEHIVVTLLLLGFLILASILFDAIGVAVTSCDEAPIIAMSSRKIYGAKTAMWLVKNSSTVASICNDVIGDIFGIISGACAAAIVVKIAMTLEDGWQRWLAIIVAGVVSALTIGGKAFMKNVAIKNSKEFVLFVARLLAFFVPEERRRFKKESQKKKHQKESSEEEESSDDKPSKRKNNR